MPLITILDATATATNSNPFDYIGIYDGLAVFLGIVLRFIYSVNARENKLSLQNEDFEFAKYFDVKHIIRWVAHVSTSIAGALFLPEFLVTYIFPRYFEGFEGWSMFGSFLIGYTGYTFFKIGEKVAALFFKKIGVNVNLKEQ